MTFDEYQYQASKTAIYDAEFRTVYPILGLASEAGEVAGKYKKFLRDGTGWDALQADMKKELGDVLWYLANVAADMGISLDDIAAANLAKLADRAARGVIKGSGDDR